MKTTNLELVREIYVQTISQYKEVSVSKELKEAIREKTGRYDCTYRSLDGYEYTDFKGELNIRKYISLEEEDGKIPDFTNGKKNFQGQECLKGYEIEIDGVTYVILERFGQHRISGRGELQGFVGVTVFVP